MPVLHWWFVIAPSALWHRLGEGGVLARVSVLTLMALYAVVTLFVVGYALLGLVAAGKFAGRAFAEGFRKSRSGP